MTGRKTNKDFYRNKEERKEERIEGREGGEVGGRKRRNEGSYRTIYIQ